MQTDSRTISTAVFSPPESIAHKPSRMRRLIYPLLVGVIYVAWVSYMTASNSWHLFADFWAMSVTMSAGSFIAGATPLGGSVVAFPVFTKVLHIPAGDARTFGLMIQAVGMTMASIIIIVRRTKILPHVVGWVSVGATLGMLAGAYFLALPAPYPKILFTFIVSAFGLALLLSHWKLKTLPRSDIPNWNNRHRFMFVAVGILGGIFSANTGNGADMFAFILMTLAFGIHEKIGTPTTVVIMAINSIVGFFIFGAMVQHVGMAWNYWLVTVPIVVLGAPLGAYVVSIVKRHHLVAFLLGLILVELISTLLLVPFNGTMIVVLGIATVFCALWFTAMLIYRRKLGEEPSSA